MGDKQDRTDRLREMLKKREGGPNKFKDVPNGRSRNISSYVKCRNLEMAFDNNIHPPRRGRGWFPLPSSKRRGKGEKLCKCEIVDPPSSPSLPSSIPTHWAPSKFLMPEAELHVRLPVELPPLSLSQDVA